ncbi:hypothetical protein [Erythrobacter sp. AP23]|uniref:hypothetical protein n=1 Tax=Erythrobacter sp. AP23 TaxID=499656 RepID=UPI00076C6107|nr:hypothetical protein [Erythrobacter sp. AP23]KWV95075.1 hypothetical protein ASS64_07790 [Erythrobacter sp. AP23]
MRIAILAALLLSGCAASNLQLERAGAASTVTRSTVALARNYTNELQLRRREAAVALVASDPLCMWGGTITVDRQWDGSRSLCDLQGVPEARQIEVSLEPIAEDRLATLTTIVAGLAAYQAALADILEEKPDEARLTLATATSTLAVAATDINRITGGAAIDLGPLTGERQDAVLTLVQTLSDMYETKMKVRKVRALVDRANTAMLIEDLETAIGRLESLQGGNADTQLLLALSLAYASEAQRAPFAERRALIREIAAANDLVSGANTEAAQELAKVLAELAKVDQAMRRALAGDFSEAERARIARENRRAVFSILSQIAAIFPPLK